ncbi:hypothetical protein AMECASPLE_038583 [Ameca splendens]|uniref:Uncharacterized protein n=1 Tax=Ameca splendens TaxID=208324 RepID=A0ABV1A586_9TELE
MGGSYLFALLNPGGDFSFGQAKDICNEIHQWKKNVLNEPEKSRILQNMVLKKQLQHPEQASSSKCSNSNLTHAGVQSTTKDLVGLFKGFAWNGKIVKLPQII